MKNMWWEILYKALERNGWKQLFFYLNNIDAVRFIEFSKTIEFLNDRNGNGIVMMIERNSHVEGVPK